MLETLLAIGFKPIISDEEFKALELENMKAYFTKGSMHLFMNNRRVDSKAIMQRFALKVTESFYNPPRTMI